MSLTYWIHGESNSFFMSLTYVEQYGTQHGALRYTKIDFFVTRFITVDLNVLLSITDVAKNKMQEFW